MDEISRTRSSISFMERAREQNTFCVYWELLPSGGVQTQRLVCCGAHGWRQEAERVSLVPPLVIQEASEDGSWEWGPPMATKPSARQYPSIPQGRKPLAHPLGSALATLWQNRWLQKCPLATRCLRAHSVAPGRGDATGWEAARHYSLFLQDPGSPSILKAL